MIATISCYDLLTDEQFAAFELCTKDKISRYPEDYDSEGLRGRLQGYGNKFDIQKLYSFSELRGLSINITMTEDTELAALSNIADRLDKIEEKVGTYTVNVASLDDPYCDKNTQFNSRVNVHVPNLGTLTMNEVSYHEDCCTDNLQNQLDDGWRILAVCVQPNQRRPDYILGRTKNDE